MSWWLMAAAVPCCAAAAMMLLRWRAAPTRSFPAPQGPFQQLVAGLVSLPIGGSSITAQVVRPATGGAAATSYYRYESLAALAAALSGSSSVRRAVTTSLFASILAGQQHPDPALGDGQSPQSSDYGSSESAMPLVIFSHGLFGSCQMYTQLCRELASYGCVVVALEHKDGSATGTRDLPYRRVPSDLKYSDREAVRAFRRPFLQTRDEEVQAVVRLLRGDPAEQLPPLLRGCGSGPLILAGHSFGAAGALRSSLSLRPALLLLYDVWGYPLPADVAVPQEQPTVCILSDSFARGPEYKAIAGATADCDVHWLPGTGHQHWSDFIWLLPARINPACQPARPEDAHRAWVAASFAAMDKALGRATPLRDAAPPPGTIEPRPHGAKL